MAEVRWLRAGPERRLLGLLVMSRQNRKGTCCQSYSSPITVRMTPYGSADVACPGTMAVHERPLSGKSTVPLGDRGSAVVASSKSQELPARGISAHFLAVRCLLRCLFISNMSDDSLPNTFASLSSALIIRRSSASCRPFFLI